MDRKTILAFLAIGAILLLMPYYYRAVSPPAVQDSTNVQAPEEQVDPSELYGNRSNVQETEPAAPIEEQLPTRTESRDQTSKWFEAEEGVTPETVHVETPLYTADFSTLGASVTSWVILPTAPYLQEPEQLVRANHSFRNLVLLARGGRGLLRTENRIFTVDKKEIRLGETSPPESVTFTLKLGEWGTYTEIYTFHPDKYTVDIDISSHGLGELTGAANALFTWGDGLASTELDTMQDVMYSAAYYLMGRTREKIKPAKKKIVEEIPVGPTRWVAQRTKYFLMAMVPEKPAYGVKVYSWPDSVYQGKHPPALFETGLLFTLKQGELAEKVTLYLGPLEQSAIKTADPSLTQTISWGMAVIKPFSIGVLWSLRLVHRFVPNYGVVLLLFSIVVKLLVWPLTQKSYVSMKRMQLLQPKMKALQEKHKGNAQKLQQEMGALYKEHKVNPIGGCLPTVLQMPLLYALFIVFRTTIELRGAPFVLWIKDLSMPDVLFQLPFTIPFYGDHVCVLPLIMALSTFLQSKSTMTDPNQKAMLYMMPLMFIFLFNNFPSGLTLYYTLFNLLSWGQQKMMKVHDPKIEKTLETLKQEQERAARKKGRSR